LLRWSRTLRCHRSPGTDNPGVERDGDSIWPKRSVAEKRRMRAKLLYDFEVECRRQDWGDPAFVYDEGKDLFRWTDGRFAFSREHADWELLRKRARLSEAMYSIVARSPQRD
jgi:hypothetical protein